MAWIYNFYLYKKLDKNNSKQSLSRNESTHNNPLAMLSVYVGTMVLDIYEAFEPWVE